MKSPLLSVEMADYFYVSSTAILGGYYLKKSKTNKKMVVKIRIAMQIYMILIGGI